MPALASNPAAIGELSLAGPRLHQNCVRTEKSTIGPQILKAGTGFNILTSAEVRAATFNSLTHDFVLLDRMTLETSILVIKKSSYEQ
jgi:hypothetical protein